MSSNFIALEPSEQLLEDIKNLLDELDNALASIGTDELRTQITSATFSGSPDSSPPSEGVIIHGYDGTYARRIKTTSDGKLVLSLG